MDVEQKVKKKVLFCIPVRTPQKKEQKAGKMEVGVCLGKGVYGSPAFYL